MQAMVPYKEENDYSCRKNMERDCFRYWWCQQAIEATPSTGCGHGEKFFYEWPE
jgi:hypothetical protein